MNDKPKKKLHELLPGHTEEHLDFGAYGLGNTVRIEAGMTTAMGDDAVSAPMLFFSIPLQGDGKHEFTLVFRHPAALEKLLSALNLLTVSGLFEDAVESSEVIHE